MLRITAQDWDDIWREIRRLAPMDDYLADVTAYSRKVGAFFDGSAEEKEEIAVTLERITAHCSAIGLRLSATYAERTAKNVREAPSLWEEVLSKSPKAKRKPRFDFRIVAKTLQERIKDELEGCLLFALNRQDAQLFNLTDNPFDKEVNDKFPGADFDICEAGRCFALERYTSCVFHLMRVTELGIKVLGGRLGMTDARPNWEPVIAKIESELRKEYKEREFKGSTDFLAGALSQFNAVKLAWRNRVMHIGEKYLRQEAKDIFDATAAFMRYLSTELKEGADLRLVNT
jgi:hypothetical protein